MCAKGFFFYFRSMNLQIKGKIQQLLKPESGVSRAGKEWKKQEFLIETVEQFPRKVLFALLNDKVSALEKVKPGDEVEVFFNIESRDYNGRWYTNLTAWKIERAVQEQDHASYIPEYRLEDIPPEQAGPEGDGLPF